MRLFDLHCDTLYRAYAEKKSLVQNDFHISINKGKVYKPWLQCMAVWIPDNVRNINALNLFSNAKKLLDSELSVLSDFCLQIKNKKDFDIVNQAEKCGIILTVEGGAVLGGDIKNLDYLNQCGVKMMTLTWNGSCEIGDGCMCKNSKGITEFGKQVIRKMNDLNMLVDVSHASEKLFYDVVEINKKPLVASHSCSKSVFNHVRNLTDEQFNIIKNSGGVVGINFADIFLNGKNNSSIYDILRHIEYFLSLGGEKTISLGSDFDGSDMPAGILGIESMNDLYELFLKKNYKEDLVNDIFFNNANKLFNKTLD